MFYLPGYSVPFIAKAMNDRNEIPLSAENIMANVSTIPSVNNVCA